MTHEHNRPGTTARSGRVDVGADRGLDRAGLARAESTTTPGPLARERVIERRWRSALRPVQPGPAAGDATPSAGAPPRRQPHIGPRLATLALLLVMALALLVAVPGLSGVRHQIGHINPVWIALAIALELASDISFVIVFRLFFDRIDARDARLLAWTNQSAAALLPGGGIGSLAIGGWLMHLAGAPIRWIARRSAGLFWLTTGMSAATVIGAGVALILAAPRRHELATIVVPTIVVASATFVVAALPRLLAGGRGPRHQHRRSGRGADDLYR